MPRLFTHFVVRALVFGLISISTIYLAPDRVGAATPTMQTRPAAHNLVDMRSAEHTSAMDWVLYLPSVLDTFVSPVKSPSLYIVPQHMRETVPQQQCVFLAVVDGFDVTGRSGPVQLEAEAPGASVSVVPTEITGRGVVEVWLVPNQLGAGRTLTATIRARLSDITAEDTATVEVLDGHSLPSGDRAIAAAEIRDLFVPWLGEEHPELSIDQQTQWDSVVVSPRILVVMHHLFFSDEWELKVGWHVMISPHDWARIYLRHRFDEARPTYAFEISSRSAGQEPVPIAPPPEVWR